MTHFISLAGEKKKLRKALLENQNVVNLLVNAGDNLEEFKDVKTGSKSPAAELVKTHFYVPGTEQGGRNYITMRNQVLGATSTHIKRVALSIYIICNIDQIDMLQGSRADLLAHEVDKIINNFQDPLFGLGGIDINLAGEVQFNEGYTGWEITYTTHERNRAPQIS